MVQALARAAGAEPAAVQRAFMLRGDLKDVAAAALRDGPGALDAFRLEVGRPVRPMLARPAKDVDEALGRLGEAAVEWKLDGARVQIHRRDDDVRVYTRSLDDVTARVPEIVEATLALPVGAAVLDGEAIALRPDGRPEPFQVTGSRFARRQEREVPLSLFVFDVLHVDGQDVLDRPGAERAALLAELVPEAQRTPRVVVSDPAAAQEFLDDAIARGHEGVMLKALDQPYVAGSRGTGWLKVKPVHTLDLVVLAAEWGHGRRRGWLSNLHLGARDPSGEGFVMLGKTFKGLTDEMLGWQTERLQELEAARDGHVVHVRPELVVEIAFDGVQSSSRYPGGVALRFARVLRTGPTSPPRRRTRWRPCSRPAASVQPDAAVRCDRPTGVVGDLPRVTLGIDEERAVAAPERLGGLAADRRSGGACLLRDGVDLLRRADVVGEGHASPPAGVLDGAVLRQPGAVPQRDHHVACLEEDDVVLGLGAGHPAQGLVEAARTGQVADAQRDQADSLSHARKSPTRTDLTPPP